MMKIPFIILILIQLQLSAQELNLEYVINNSIDLNSVSNGNEEFEGYEKLDSILKNVEIVMLGEQSHQDGTTFDTKVKLIKYLHEKLGFNILAFESSMYECEKAWEEILKGGDIRINLGKSINTFWSPLNEFKYLSDYIQETIKSKQPLKVKGFDNQFGGAISEDTFVNELKDYLIKKDPSLINLEILNTLNHKILKRLWYLELKKIKKKDSKKVMKYLQDVIVQLSTNQNIDYELESWLRNLKNLHSFISDLKFNTDFRDEEMAKNLIWLKERNPNEKINYWGATSHFLYNSSDIKFLKPLKSEERHFRQTKMMGTYVKEILKDKVYTIGFTTYEGEYGTIGFGQSYEIEPPIPHSLEYLLGKSNYENFLLPFDETISSNLPSRPLGHVYMKNDISSLMDAIIFNRKMERPTMDLELFKRIYPKHKYIK